MVPGKVQFYLPDFICSVVNTVFNEVNEPGSEHSAPTSLHLIMPHPLFLYVRLVPVWKIYMTNFTLEYTNRIRMVQWIERQNSDQSLWSIFLHTAGTFPSLLSCLHYRSGTVNSKSFVGKVLLRIKWKFELTYAL